MTEDRGSKASKAGLILSTGLILSPGPHGHHGGALARKAPVWRATLPTLLCVVLRAPLLSIEILRAAKGQEEWEDSSDKQYPPNPERRGSEMSGITRATGYKKNEG